MLLKLWSLGITGPLWTWFKEYLSNRQHFVYINGASSSLLPVYSGVPQGSILGPLLFLVYVNDIPTSICHSTAYLFADDTKFVKRIFDESNAMELQLDINSLHRWCEKWLLSLHPDKCFAVRYGLSTYAVPEYLLDDKPIKSTNVHRDLGILMTSNLSWSSHYDHICSRAYSSLYLIRRSFSAALSPNLKKQLYLALVRSHLCYCSQVWRPRLLKDIATLERVQRRATKYILHDYVTDYKTRLTSLHLLPLMYWLDLLDILFLVKCLQDKNDTINIFKYISFVECPTRAGSTKKLKHNYCRTSTSRHFYYNRVVLLWNSLPMVDLNQSFSSIKCTVLAHLWNHFYKFFDPTNPCKLSYLCPCSKCYVSPRA